MLSQQCLHENESTATFFEEFSSLIEAYEEYGGNIRHNDALLASLKTKDHPQHPGEDPSDILEKVSRATKEYAKGVKKAFKLIGATTKSEESESKKITTVDKNILVGALEEIG